MLYTRQCVGWTFWLAVSHFIVLYCVYCWLSSQGGPEVYRLATSQGAAIKDLFDCVAHGRPLPEPPAQNVKRSVSGTTVTTTVTDDSDTWSLASFQTATARPYGSTPSAFVFANDTVSLSSYSTLTDEISPECAPPHSAGSSGGMGTSGGGRRPHGEYDYIAVDMHRRPTATNERDVSYFLISMR